MKCSNSIVRSFIMKPIKKVSHFPIVTFQRVQQCLISGYEKRKYLISSYNKTKMNSSSPKLLTSISALHSFQDISLTKMCI